MAGWVCLVTCVGKGSIIRYRRFHCRIDNSQGYLAVKKGVVKALGDMHDRFSAERSLVHLAHASMFPWLMNLAVALSGFFM